MSAVGRTLAVLSSLLICGGAATSPAAAGEPSTHAAGPPASKAALESARGHREALVLFATFADGTEWVEAPAWAADLLDPTLPGSLSHFYAVMSLGALQVRGAAGPRVYRSRYHASHYVATDPTREGGLGAFCREVLEAADSDIDFARFDNDGPDGIPASGDDDGIVDAVFIVVPRTPPGFLLGAATGMDHLGRWEDMITDDAGAGGTPVRVAAWQGTIQQGRSFEEAAGAMCHEFGHVLGLPDLYDTDYLYRLDPDPGDDSAGIGAWGVMGWGALGWRGDDGPVGMSAVSRLLLGWAEVAEPRQAVTRMELEDVGRHGSVYRIPLGPEEYFLLEYRRPSSTFYDRHLPAGGVLIWHVATGTGGRMRADLECADGRWLEAGYPLGQTPDPGAGGDNLDFWAHDEAYAHQHAGNLGDASDPFDGDRYRAFTPDTNPAADSRDGRTRVRVEDIRLGATAASARVTVAEAGLALDDVFIGDLSGADLIAGAGARVHFTATNTGGVTLTGLRLRLSTTEPLLGVPEADVELRDLAVGARGTASWLAAPEPPAIRPARAGLGDYEGVVHVEVRAGDRVLAARDLAVGVRGSVLLSGRVVDDTGTGIEDIRALLHGAGGYATAVRSADDGAFEVYLPPDSYTITANPDGISSTERTRRYASRLLTDMSIYTDQDLTVVLRPRLRVSGQVRAADGAPLAGVSVRAKGEQTSGTGTTDAAGRYELWIPPGTYTFHVALPPDSPDLAPYAVDGVEVTDAARVDLDLPPSIALTTRVVDQTGAPVGNVSLRLRDDEHEAGQQSRTDLRGEATFRVLPGVGYHLYLSDLPPGVLAPAPMAVAARGDTVLQVLLPAGVPVTVRLRGSDGGPIQSGSLLLLSLDEPGVSAFARSRDGVYTAAVRPGRYRVSIDFREAVGIPAQELGVIDVVDSVDVDLVVDRGVVVEVSVTDEDGTAVSGGLLGFVLDPSIETEQRWHNMWQYPVAADGTVRAPLLANPYRVLYQLPWSMQGVGDLPPPQDLGALAVTGPRSVDYTVRRGVPVEGRVVTATATDPSQFTLRATGLDTSASGRALVLSDGSFRMRLLPGTYRLVATGSGTAPGAWLAGEIEAPAPRALLLHEPGGAALSGRVVDRLGTPVGVSLWLLRPCRAGPCYDSESSPRFRASTYTSTAPVAGAPDGAATAPGAYRISTIPDRYDLVLVQYGTGRQRTGWVRRDLDLSVDRTEDFVVSEPEPAYRVSGAVHGHEAPGLRQIQFLDEDTGYCGWANVDDLEYSIDLPPARYEVTALLRHARGGLHGREDYLGTVDVAGDTRWDVRLPDVDTVVEAADAVRPARFALDRGYPNPFNATITLPFSVAVAGPVQLTVYNLLGQPLRRLSQPWLDAGSHVVRWDGRDASGRPAGSGLYICRLVSGDRAAVRKILLLR